MHTKYFFLLSRKRDENHLKSKLFKSYAFLPRTLLYNIHISMYSKYVVCIHHLSIYEAVLP